MRETFSLRFKIESIFLKIAPKIICVDVGAAYWPHLSWEMFRWGRLTEWLAVDPNAESLNYTKCWWWPSNLLPVATALSENPGNETLYVTNVATGSSMLKPLPINSHLAHRADPAYFFPYAETVLPASTLTDLLSDYREQMHPLMIKLDTQGTEIKILKGLDDKFFEKMLVCVEFECSLSAIGYYEGVGKFYEAQRFMESKGFELVDLNLVSPPSPSFNASLTWGKGILNECDAVFMLRPDLLVSRPISHRLAAIGCYIAYKVYSEALHQARLLISDDISSDLHARLNALIGVLEQ